MTRRRRCEKFARSLAPEPNKANITGVCRLRWFSIPLENLAANAERES